MNKKVDLWDLWGVLSVPVAPPSAPYGPDNSIRDTRVYY